MNLCSPINHQAHGVLGGLERRWRGRYMSSHLEFKYRLKLEASLSGAGGIIVVETNRRCQGVSRANRQSVKLFDHNPQIKSVLMEMVVEHLL